MPNFSADALELAATEIEQFVDASGWDQRPALFALVRAADLRRDDPALADRLGLGADAPADALTPIEQEALPEGELDQLLARIAWPESVAGCALAHEIVILPPSAEAELAAAGGDHVHAAADHPDRREARLVVAVLRDGTNATVLRLRSETDDELLTGPDLAPNLVGALVATLSE